MNRRSLFLLSVFFVIVMWLQGCSPSPERNAAGGFWNTGIPALDSALQQADTLDRVIEYDSDRAYEAYLRISALSDTASQSGRVRAIAYYAKGVLAEFEEEGDVDPKVVSYDSIALNNATSEAGSQYICRRLEFELAIKNSDVRSRTKELYSLLPYFTSLQDSMLVTDILFELTNSFGDVWNPDMQTDCFREIIRWTPEFVAPLRELMRYNILAVERGMAEPAKYLHILDSVASDRALLKASPPMAVMVYSDRYRLRGNPADLDSASAYAASMPVYHDALKTYWSQQLYHSLKTHDSAKADRFASLIEEHASDSSIMEIETLPALRGYYKYSGDSIGYDRADRLYKFLKTTADAHEESTELAGIEADRKVSDITKRSHTESRKWIIISITVLILLVAVSIWLFRVLKRRKNDMERLGELSSELDCSRRKLIVAEMRNTENSMQEQHCASADEWERFEAVFTEMHPGFADGLRRDFPNLTRNDIRLCAFISMDMDIKHIAKMLAIQPDSVKKQMRRLRTKLGLEPAAPLRDFLTNY